MSLKNAAWTALVFVAAVAPVFSQSMGRVTGVVIDQFNAMTLPMAPIEVVETGAVFYTELDGRYSFELPRKLRRSSKVPPAGEGLRER